ncbi:hypothetical protein O7635_22935 [Asanoa sp. WMMD1127]|uniref:hypothetical protein n=1 Tax=Asanoa sp. WMMD1127 TaxID=3016107 RepID=UPI0024163543|nr:hypothetical protein [Asanoa sp. WMMD1127]MDG4824717.1 hypothetical protein [Asanoa sp. WMMD1127]
MDLMLHSRLAYYYPQLAARTPVREMCRMATGAGTAILSAGASLARDRAFAALEQRWQPVPDERQPAPIPTGPVQLRYVSYTEPHEDYDVHREGSAVVLAAAPESDLAAPWRLAGQEITDPSRLAFRATALHGVQEARRAAGSLSVGDLLAEAR